MRSLPLVAGIAAVQLAMLGGCKTRPTEFNNKANKDASVRQDQPAEKGEGIGTESSDSQRTIANIPQNGEIASAEIRRTSGNSLSGRTITGTANAIPRSSSFLRNMGGHFTQLYDIHSDNFAVGTIGVNGQFAYVMYLNPTLGYINPVTLTLMYCEPQLVSQSSDVVAILDCMDALPLSKISKTAKYGNGNPVFDIAGNVLYEDGAKATNALTWWKSINDKTMFQGTVATYGNGQKMRDGSGTAWFSDGKIAYDPLAKTLKYSNGTSNFSVTGDNAFYMDGATMMQTSPTGVTYFYQGGATQKVLSYLSKPDGSRSSTIYYKNGSQALYGTQVFRQDGSEAPVEVFAVEETPQSAVIWSASQLYTNLSISQYTKEATFNVIDEYVGTNSIIPGVPQNPINLTMTSPSATTLTAVWASGGGTTAGFTYKMAPGATAPADCVGGVDSGATMTVNFAQLTPSTTYSLRVCARNSVGVLSSGVTVSGTTQAAPPPPPPTNVLFVNQRLGGNEHLTVAGKNSTCNFRLLMQWDGNLVVYRLPSTPIWSTRTGGRGVSFVTLQGDRNVVVYLARGGFSWMSRTQIAGGDPKAKLEILPNGLLVLKNGAGNVVWNNGVSIAACN
jgi:hypothetical protein